MNIISESKFTNEPTVSIDYSLEITQYYNNLLNKLNVPLYYNIINNIIANNNVFYEYYAKMHLNKKEENNEGVKNIIKNTEEFECAYHSEVYIINKEEDNHRASFSMYNYNMCILLLIPKKDNCVYLDIINYFSTNKAKKQRLELKQLLFEVAMQFISVIQSEYNLKYIRSKDTAKLYLNYNNAFINMSDYFMLTTGNTFFGKHNFVSYDVMTDTYNGYSMVNYLVNKKLMFLIKIKNTDIKQYLVNITKKYNIHINVKHIIKQYVKLPLFECLHKFIKNYDDKYIIFNEIYFDIMKNIGITSMVGTVYYKKLE